MKPQALAPRPPFRLTLIVWLTGLATALFVAFAYVGISGQEIREALIDERESEAKATVARIESRLEAELLAPLRSRGESFDLAKNEQKSLARAIIRDGLENSGFETYYRFDRRGKISLSTNEDHAGRSFAPTPDLIRAFRGDTITTRLSQGEGAPKPRLLPPGEDLEHYFRRFRRGRRGRKGREGRGHRRGPDKRGPDKRGPDKRGSDKRGPDKHRLDKHGPQPKDSPASSNASLKEGSAQPPYAKPQPKSPPKSPTMDSRRPHRRPPFPIPTEERVDFDELRGLVFWVPIKTDPIAETETPKIERIVYLGESAQGLRNTATLRGLAQASFSTLGVLFLMVALSLSIRKANRTMVEQANEVMEANRELGELSESLERQVEERSQQLLQAKTLASIGRLSAGVAHEVCNPTASIASCAEGLLRELRDPKAFQSDEARGELREYLEIIRDEAFRIKGITRNLLDFSRGAEEDRHEDVDIGQVLEATLRLVAHRLDSEGKTLELDLEPAHIRGSSSGLRQLILNLTVNAIDAIEQGDRIQWTLRPAPDGGAELVCEDDGPGFNPEDLEAALEPFHTTKPVGEGTGLGLAIAYSIAKQHGGLIRLANKKTGGARVTVNLAPEKGA